MNKDKESEDIVIIAGKNKKTGEVLIREIIRESNFSDLDSLVKYQVEEVEKFNRQYPEYKHTGFSCDSEQDFWDLGVIGNKKRNKTN